MSTKALENVLIELQSGEFVAVGEICTIGRAPSNTIAVPSAMASRRHAAIHLRDDESLQITDLGSSNGTYVNARRVVHQTRLHDGDVIEIGDQRFVLRAPEMPNPFPADRDVVETPGTRLTQCWLLAAGSPTLDSATRAPAAEAAFKTVGGWEFESARCLENFSGTLTTHPMCDLLCYWPVGEYTQPGDILRSLKELDRLRVRHRPACASVLHRGQVLLGAAGKSGESTPTGANMAFVIQTLKLLWTLPERCLISESAHELLEGTGPLKNAGVLSVNGFSDHRFFTL